MQSYTMLYAGLLISFGGAVLSCSDATQFTERGAGFTTSQEGAPTPPSEDVTVAIPPEVTPYTAEVERTESESEPLIREAVSSGSGIMTNDQSPSSTSLSQAQRDALLASCTAGTQKTITRQIKFPAAENCQWNKDGNLGRRNGYLQAAEAQSSLLTLPASAQLCSLSLGSQTGTLHYDDFLILTLNGYVLLSSNQKLLQSLSGSAATAYQWDFAKVKGKAVDFNSPAYCLGNTGTGCQVPVTDVAGRFNFEMNPTSLLHLADQVYDEQKLNFSLIATGDNDDRDCFHTEMTLEFSLQYVVK